MSQATEETVLIKYSNIADLYSMLLHVFILSDLAFVHAHAQIKAMKQSQITTYVFRQSIS